MVGRRQILDALDALAARPLRALNDDGDALAEPHVVEGPGLGAALASDADALLAEGLLEQRPGRLPIVRRQAVTLFVDADAGAGQRRARRKQREDDSQEAHTGRRPPDQRGQGARRMPRSGVRGPTSRLAALKTHIALVRPRKASSQTPSRRVIGRARAFFEQHSLAGRHQGTAFGADACGRVCDRCVVKECRTSATTLENFFVSAAARFCYSRGYHPRSGYRRCHHRTT